MDPIMLCVFMFGVLVGVLFVAALSSFNHKDYRREKEKAEDAMKR